MITQFEQWLNKTNKELKEKYYSKFGEDSVSYKNLYYTKGRKFIKVLREDRTWGFISMVNGTHKGEPVKEGDLLLAATWSQPAKHNRGNIFDGTARYDLWGPEYLK